MPKKLGSYAVDFAREFAATLSGIAWQLAYTTAILLPGFLYFGAPELSAPAADFRYDPVTQTLVPDGDADFRPLVWIGVTWLSVLIFFGLVVLRRMLASPRHSP